MCDRSIVSKMDTMRTNLLETRKARLEYSRELTQVQSLMGKLALNVVSDATLHVALENYLEFRESILEDSIRELDEILAELRRVFVDLRLAFEAEVEQTKQDYTTARDALQQALDDGLV